MDIIRQGEIKCECGNKYHFKSMREAIICMQCGKMNPNNGELCEDIEDEKIEEDKDEEITE